MIASKSIKTIIAALIILSFGWANGQSLDCKAELSKVLEKINAIESSSQTIHAAKIVILAVPKDSLELERVERSFTIFSKGKKVLYESAEMSIYTDEKYVANVLHEDKTVYLSKAAKDEKETPKFSSDYLNKAFLNYAEVRICKAAPTTSCPDCHLIDLSISNGVLASRGITSIRYQYDPKANTVVEVKLTYGDQVEDAYAILKYFPANTSKAEVTLNKPVHSILFSSAENLRPAYKDYKLVKTYK